MDNPIYNEELKSRIKEQIDINRDLYQLCSLISTHLRRYEDTERFDKRLLDIVIRAKAASEGIDS